MYAGTIKWSATPRLRFGKAFLIIAIGDLEDFKPASAVQIHALLSIFKHSNYLRYIPFASKLIQQFAFYHIILPVIVLVAHIQPLKRNSVTMKPHHGFKPASRTAARNQQNRSSRLRKKLNGLNDFGNRLIHSNGGVELVPLLVAILDKMQAVG